MNKNKNKIPAIAWAAVASSGALDAKSNISGCKRYDRTDTNSIEFSIAKI